VAIPALLVWLWRAPVRGVYVLVAAAVMQEAQYSPLSYPDDIGHYVPFFLDFATWTHVAGLSFSLAEIFMLLVLLIWLLKGIAGRTLRFHRGTLLIPLGLYSLMVAAGEVHGLSSGGDFRLSLWEIRPQAYMLITYILACNLLTSKKEIDRVLWIIMLGAGLKGLQGTFRLYFSLHGSLQSVDSLFPHEQSFFFNAFLSYLPILLLYGGSARLRRIMVALLPFVVIADLANQRRAAILALALGLAVLLVVTAVARPSRRRLVTKILLVAAVILPPYYLYYQNKDGLIAQPARAIAANFHPDARDASSNLYRVNEDKDILATMQTSPIFGYGFGKPFLTPYPLADITAFDIFWNIMPHDGILYVWMRLGTIGYLLLWILIGTAIIQAARLVMRLEDPYWQGWAMLILLLVMQQVVVAYLDLQWENYRNLIFLGAMFAVLGTLPGAVDRSTISTYRRPAWSPRPIWSGPSTSAAAMSAPISQRGGRRAGSQG
jgi:O-antigen ligase